MLTTKNLEEKDNIINISHYCLLIMMVGGCIGFTDRSTLISSCCIGLSG